MPPNPKRGVQKEKTSLKTQTKIIVGLFVIFNILTASGCNTLGPDRKPRPFFYGVDNNDYSDPKTIVAEKK